MKPYRTPEQWAKIRPDAFLDGSIVQARNIIEMMQQDIAKLANQLANEREECAKIVDFMADNAKGGELRILSLRAAEAIRRRGKEPHR
jgi:hypothetical protein